MYRNMPTISKQRSGIFGRVIEYQVPLKFSEIETVLHKNHQGTQLKPYYMSSKMVNSFSYPHPTVMNCEILVIRRWRRGVPSEIANAKGRITRAPEDQVATIHFTTKLTNETWIVTIIMLVITALIIGSLAADGGFGVFMLIVSGGLALLFGYTAMLDLKALHKSIETMFWK
jgi:hypothetical protein